MARFQYQKKTAYIPEVHSFRLCLSADRSAVLPGH